MNHHMPVMTSCLESVVKGEPDATRLCLRRYMNDADLTEFRAHVVTLLYLIDEEINRRNGKLYQSTPVADTGEINVIRGRE